MLLCHSATRHDLEHPVQAPCEFSLENSKQEFFTAQVFDLDGDVDRSAEFS